MERIRQSFNQQGLMRTLGASLESIESGTVTVACAFDERLTQQHGLLHGGVLASLVDVACGYAALTMMPEDREVLTVEFKINFLKPAHQQSPATLTGKMRNGESFVGSDNVDLFLAGRELRELVQELAAAGLI